MSTLNNGRQQLQQPQRNTIAACKIQFSGQQNQEAVEEFINGVETFKKVEDINDEDALKGVSLLFTDTASLWWQGVGKNVTTWSECLKLLKETFAPKKPAYQIYKDIFAEAQDNNTRINLFIIRKRALFSQLPDGRHTEAEQIDMIYSLIHFKYRQYMRRNEISTYEDLLQKGREIEQLHAEGNMGGVGGEKIKPKRCSFCNYRGHTAEDCRRRQQRRGPSFGDQQQHHQQKDMMPGKDKPYRNEDN
ncbi:activity-regulated cytoskeleton associated protein 2-like [Musca autumnalis]|uniref:activity-regulated cytoskeleton associated protein 2-like n=1 Tax=Musca autumnalis TaxID=221902 RepID=UPI003CF6EBC0